MVEHGTENAGVDSSSLSLGTSALKSGSGSVVEHLLAKERVEGSNPFFRSNLNHTKSPKFGDFFFTRSKPVDWNGSAGNLWTGQFLINMPGWQWRQ